MVRTWHFHFRGPGSIPGWVIKILQALRHSQRKKTNKQIVTLNLKSKIQLHVACKKNFKYIDTGRLKIRGWKKDTKYKKSGMSISISERVDFRIRNIIRDEERHFIK